MNSRNDKLPYSLKVFLKLRLTGKCTKFAVLNCSGVEVQIRFDQNMTVQCMFCISMHHSKWIGDFAKHRRNCRVRWSYCHTRVDINMIVFIPNRKPRFRTSTTLEAKGKTFDQITNSLAHFKILFNKGCF